MNPHTPEPDTPATLEAAALEARGVAVRFADGTTALAGVDLVIPRGRTVALVGESGSGKTTLLRTFNRMVEPTAGDVFADGRPIREIDPIELRRRTGYVQQEGGLLPHWTVARNVALVPRLSGMATDERTQRARDMLELVGLDPERYGERHPRELSGGERQRVAFARALAGDPPVVLLDEPFGALDALTRRELQELFLDLARRLGKTLVLVTHDLAEAFRLADRVAVMRRGEILAEAPPAELADRARDDTVHPYVEALLAAHGARS
jgi:osmoprotectant transport system ATP-binding protein